MKHHAHWAAVLLFNALFMVAPTRAQSFHTTSDQNTSGHITTLDFKHFNGEPNRLLFVSQIYGDYNPHQIGVWYDEGRWTIFNQDRTPIPIDTKFAVVGINPASPKAPAFRHIVSKDNISPDDASVTILDSPLTNGKLDAVLLVTPNYGIYDAHPLGVWYDNGHWTIFHQDQAAMEYDLEYNVLVLQPGRNAKGAIKAQVHTVNIGNIEPDMDWISNISGLDQNTLPLFTQLWDSANGVTNNHIPGLWYSDNGWTIFNQDRAAMPLSAKFNVVEFPTSAALRARSSAQALLYAPPQAVVVQAAQAIQPLLVQYGITTKPQVVRTPFIKGMQNYVFFVDPASLQMFAASPQGQTYSNLANSNQRAAPVTTFLQSFMTVKSEQQARQYALIHLMLVRAQNAGIKFGKVTKPTVKATSSGGFRVQSEMPVISSTQPNDTRKAFAVDLQFGTDGKLERPPSKYNFRR